MKHHRIKIEFNIIEYLLGFVFLILIMVGCGDSVEKGQVVNEADKDSLNSIIAITKLVDDFKRRDKEAIAGKIDYPLNRSFPLSDIQNKREMLQRFSEVFDDSLSGLISSSDPFKDWSEVGYRGIMLLNGVIWMDYEGKIKAVNFDSKLEQQKIIALNKEDSINLHVSLRRYLDPILQFTTADYQVRIDKMTESDYRFASWKLGASMSTKPETIIDNGQIQYEGSGGNHCYVFKIGDYSYICSIQVLGFEDIPGELIIMKGDKEMLEQPFITLNK